MCAFQYRSHFFTCGMQVFKRSWNLFFPHAYFIWKTAFKQIRSISFCGKNSSEHVDKIPFKTLRYFFEKVRKNIEFVLLLLVPCTGQVHLIKHAQTRITFWFLNTLPATAYGCPQVKRTGVISNSSWKLSNLANLRK